MTYMTHLSDLALPISGTSGPDSPISKSWWNHDETSIYMDFGSLFEKHVDDPFLDLHSWNLNLYIFGSLLEAVACFARIHGEFVVVSMLCPSTTLLHGWGHSTNICQLKWKGCEKDVYHLLSCNFCIHDDTHVHLILFADRLMFPCVVFFGNLGHMFSHVFSHISDKQSAESSLLWRKDWGRIGIFHLCNPWLSFSASRWKRWNPGHWGKNSRGVLKPIKYPQTNHYNDITSMDQHLYKSCIIYHLFGIWPFFGHSLRDLSGRHRNPDWRFRSVSTQHQLPATWSSRTRNRCPRCPDFTTPQDGYNMAIIWVGIIWV